MKYSAGLTKLIAKCGYERTAGALMQKCIVYVRDCLVMEWQMTMTIEHKNQSRLKTTKTVERVSCVIW